MKTNWKSLSLAAFGAITWFAIAAAPARARFFPFGYAGPGISIRAHVYPGYYGGGFYGGGLYPGYYGGGFYGGGLYPGYIRRLSRPGLGPLGGGPVFMQPQRIVPAQWIVPGGYYRRLPYGWYGPYRRFYLW
jgi:hypothetical protein